VVAPPTFQQLEQELSPAALERFRPHILHFLGHGEEDGLWFEKRDGSGERIPTNRLCRLLQRASLPFALINACWSATARARSICEQLVEAGVCAAVGHGMPVADRSAIVFAQRFYELVVQGLSIGPACQRAANHLVESGLGGANEIEIHGDQNLRLAAGLASGEGHGRVEDGGLLRGYLPGAGFFYGRAEEYLEIARSLDEPELCASGIWGVGGIGKTRLAVEVARRNAWRYHDGGVAFVDAREVSEKTARAMLQLALTRLVPGAEDLGDPIAGLVRTMSRAPALVILDNLETLPDDEHTALARNLARLPRNGSRVLLTARARLAVVEELPDARSLTLTRGLDDYNGAHYAHRIAVNRKVAALDVVPEVRAGRVEGPCAALSRRVSGHPKMIELAVNVARKGRDALDEALAQVGGDLERQLQGLLQTGLHYVEQQGLRLLPYLVLFPTGQFMPEAMHAVCGTRAPTGGEHEEDQEKAEEAARALIKEGLQQLERGGYLDFDQDKSIYTFHPTLLDFVKRRKGLTETERNDGTLTLLAFYARYLSDNTENYPAIDRCYADALLWMEAIWQGRQGPAPVDAALVVMVDALGDYFDQRGLWHSGDRWHERLIELRATSKGVRNEAARAQALYRWGILLEHRGRIDASRSALSESLRIYEDLGDQLGQGAALHQLALIEHNQGNPAEARRLQQRSFKIAEDFGDQQAQGASLQLLAMIEHDQGNSAEARRLLQRSLKIKEDLDDQFGQAASLQLLAMIEHDQGNSAEARRPRHSCLKIQEALGDQRGQAASLHHLASIEYDQGNPAEARRLLQRSLKITEDLGDQRGQAASLYQLAVIEHSQGNPTEARRLLQRSLKIDEELGHQNGQAVSLHELARIEYAQGNSAEARRLLQRSLKILEDLGEQGKQAVSLHELARIESDQGNPTEARRLLQRSLKLAEDIGDQQGQAAALHGLAVIEDDQGNPAEARQLLRRSLKIEEDIGDQRGQAGSLHVLAKIEYDLGNPAEARRLSEQSLTISAGSGDVAGQAATLCMLAQLDANDGAVEMARTRAQRAVQLLERIGAAHAATARSILVEIESRAGGQGAAAGKAESARLRAEATARWNAGKYPEALAVLEQALMASVQEKSKHNQAMCLLGLGQVLLAMARPREALERLREGLEIATDLGNQDLLRGMRRTAAEAMRAAALEDSLQRPLDEMLAEAGSDEKKAEVLLVRATALERRSAAGATALVDKALELARRAGAPRLVVAALCLRGTIAASDGKTTEARHHLAAALRLAEEAKMHEEASDLAQMLAALEHQPN
jgi:tetratricopeptide (TPR) repeat protein